MDKINKNKIEGVSGGVRGKRGRYVIKVNDTNGNAYVCKLTPGNKEMYLKTITEIHGFDDIEKIAKYYNDADVRK